MRTSEKLIILIIILGVAAVTTYLAVQGEGNEEYKARINRKRHEIDQFMKYSVDSPFKGEAEERFNGLKYFPPDRKYRVIAQLIPIGQQDIELVPLTDGSIEAYIRYAYAEFTLENNTHRLLLLKPEKSRVANRLFLAFMDDTNGKETYGGGRYINLYQLKEDEVTIDFNLAYNPYCVYDYSYACPLPLPENRLAVTIRAGEKLYQE